MPDQSARVVVVTGGATGIGKAAAASFVRDGHHVVMVSRNEAVLRGAAADLGPRAHWRKADVSQRDQVADTVASIVAEFGVIDVLVNSAGISRGGVSATTPLAQAEETWDALAAVNVKGTMLMTLACVPHLRRPGGRVINISSGAVFTGGVFPGLMAYAGTKAAVHAMTLSLARELGPDGITVNVVAPGFIAETGMTASVDQENLTRLAAVTLVKRNGLAEDIAAAVHYLASPAASFVSAQVLQVDGGRLPG